MGLIYWKVLSYTGNSYICPQPGGQVRGDIEVVKKNFGPARGGTPKIMVGHGCLKVAGGRALEGGWVSYTEKYHHIPVIPI